MRLDNHTPIIYGISQSTFTLSHNQIWHSRTKRTKHMDLDLLCF